MRLARVRQLSCYVTSRHTLVAYGVSCLILSKVAMLRQVKFGQARLLQALPVCKPYSCRPLTGRLRPGWSAKTNGLIGWFIELVGQMADKQKVRFCSDLKRLNSLSDQLTILFFWRKIKWSRVNPKFQDFEQILLNKDNSKVPIRLESLNDL